MAELALCQSGKRLQLVSLPRIAATSNCPQVRNLIQAHLRETEYQLQKLSGALATCGQEPPEKVDPVTTAILKGCHRIAVDFKDTPALNAALAGILQRIRYGELGVYECLLEWALLLNNTEASRLLRQLVDHVKGPPLEYAEVLDDQDDQWTLSNPSYRSTTSDRFGHLVHLTS